MINNKMKEVSKKKVKLYKVPGKYYDAQNFLDDEETFVTC